jgi:hypothetical protein
MVIPETGEAESSGIYSALPFAVDPGQAAGAAFRDDTADSAKLEHQFSSQTRPDFASV